MIIDPQAVPESTGSNYPEPFKSLVAGRVKKRLGNAAGLQNFGVNLTTLQPGSRSSLRHWHTKQDEFIYILAGEVTLVTNAGEHILKPGMAAGFPAGEADGHHLINHSDAIVVYLEVGDRPPDDQGFYPDDDLAATSKPGGGWLITHKDGSPY